MTSESPSSSNSSNSTSDIDEFDKAMDFSSILSFLDEDDSRPSEKSEMISKSRTPHMDESLKHRIWVDDSSATFMSQSSNANNLQQNHSQNGNGGFNIQYLDIKEEAVVQQQNQDSTFSSQSYPAWSPAISEGFGLLPDPTAANAWSPAISEGFGLLPDPTSANAWSPTISEGFGLLPDPIAANAWSPAISEGFGLLPDPTAASTIQNGFPSLELRLSNPSDIFSNFSQNIWSQWRSAADIDTPRSFSTYVAFSTQFVGYVFFHNEYPDVQTMENDNLTTTVLDPVGRRLTVNITKDTNHDKRQICSFQARYPGMYTVSVTSPLGRLASVHVTGSPFTIPVSRNYRLTAQLLPLNSYICPAVKAWGITYNPLNEKMYVADRETHQILTYNSLGIQVDSFGLIGSGSDTEKMHRPTGIAIDARNQRIVVSDKDNHRICFYDMNGVFLSAFGQRGHKNGEFHYPWGVDVSPDGEIIVVADSRNHRIQMFDQNGNFLRKYSVFETNPFEFKTEFNYPRGVAFDKEGLYIYVTDFNIHTVFKLDVELTTRTNIIPDNLNMSRPQGLVVDAVGNVLVCDSRNNCIRVFSSEGELVTSILGGNSSLFHMPQDIMVFPNGFIAIVDSNSNIRVF